MPNLFRLAAAVALTAASLTACSSTEPTVPGATLAALIVPLAACGDDGEEASSGPIRPNVEFAGVSGKTTAIKLDKGFVDALGSLGLTPGTVGDGRLAKGSLVFPRSE